MHTAQQWIALNIHWELVERTPNTWDQQDPCCEYICDWNRQELTNEGTSPIRLTSGFPPSPSARFRHHSQIYMHILATVCQARYCGGDVMLIAVCDRNIDDLNVDQWQSHIVLDFGDSVISVHLLAFGNPSPDGRFYYKMVHTNLPIYFNTLPLIRNQDIHGHNTRCRNKIGTIRTKHEFAKRCIRYSLAHTINSLPSCIQDRIFTHSLSGLSIYSKQFLLNKYESNCQIINCYICNWCGIFHLHTDVYIHAQTLCFIVLICFD